MLLIAESSRRLPVAIAIAALAACGTPADETVETKQSYLCPDGPCVPPRDPPDPPPTGWYPATGWNVIYASDVAVERGVQWWAYQWQGNVLAVKGYYPADFGGGIPVGMEPAHVFINVDVASPTDWKADVKLVYQTHFNGPLYPTGHVESSVSDDGVISRYMRVPPPYSENGDIGTTTSDVNEGWYVDDGTGARLVWGADISQRPTSQAVMNFMTDFNSNGGVLFNPDQMPYCDEACTAKASGGLQNFFLRRASYLASLAAPAEDPFVTCGAGGALTALCGVGGAWAAGWAPLLAALGPPGLLAGGIIASVCAAAIYDDIHCGLEIVEEKRQEGGPCVNTVMITGPITGPDGRPYDHSNVMIDVYRCPF
jgi:hypothetical protein